jgi:hypothetical protein
LQASINYHKSYFRVYSLAPNLETMEGYCHNAHNGTG